MIALPSGRRFLSKLIGMRLNFFVSIRLSDLARGYLMGEALSASNVYVLGTVAIETFLAWFVYY